MTRSYKYSSLFTFFFLEHDGAKHCFPSVANANIFYVELFSFYWKIFKLAFHCMTLWIFFVEFTLFLCFLFLLKKHGIWVYFGGNFAFSNEYVKNLNCILIYFLKNEILTWNQLYNIKYISNNVFIIFVWTKECDFILTISWFRQQCYCVGYALLFWCVVSFVYM